MPMISTRRVAKWITNRTGVPRQGGRRPHVHHEETRGREDISVGLQELLPLPFLPLRRRFNAVLRQNIGDGPSSNAVIEIGESSLKPRTAPVTILRLIQKLTAECSCPTDFQVLLVIPLRRPAIGCDSMSGVERNGT
jgi:hypothetical protein